MVDPYLPICGDPCIDQRFELETFGDQPAVQGGTRFFFGDGGQLQASYGPGYVDEVFYVASPNGTVYEVVLAGLTDDMDYESGASGTPVDKVVVDQSGQLYTFRVKDDGTLYLETDVATVVEGAITPTFTEEHCV